MPEKPKYHPPELPQHAPAILYQNQPLHYLLNQFTQVYTVLKELGTQDQAFYTSPPSPPYNTTNLIAHR